MNQDNPLLLAGLLVGVGYVASLWWSDLRRARAGAPSPAAFPGATPAPPRILALGILGALALLGLEVLGEYRLGLVGAQREITVLFAVYTLAAGFGEELVFRGYLVVSRRGRAALVASIVGFSLLFALAHPYLWAWDDGFRWTPGPKAWFTTSMLFAGSLWFYALRFHPWNPSRSLLPSIAAHVAKNAGVVAVKAAQGFVSGWW